MRKLPVYIVVDTSESMYGEAIDQINRSLDNMLAALHRNPYALETVWLSLITFDSNARVLAPLTELADFKLPLLKSRPGTALGTAIELLRSQIAKEVQLSSADNKGDWRPIVFLLTDGQPTDEWRGACAKLRASRPKPANIYAIGVGNEINFKILKELADVTFQVEEATPETLAKLFIWMSSAIQSVSKNASQEGLSAEELHTPAGVTTVGDDYPAAPDFPRQLFFHGTCSTTKKKYLMRLRYVDQFEAYFPANAYKVPDDFLSDGGFEPPRVDADKILGFPDCPYCDNQDTGVCLSCNEAFCFNNNEVMKEGGKVVCPACGEVLTFLDEGADCQLRPSAG